MRQQRDYVWMIGLVATILIIVVPIALFVSADGEPSSDPWDKVPSALAHTDHSALITDPVASPQEMTKVCLSCHEDAAHDVMQTTHWTWESDPLQLPGRDTLVTVGKKNQINNFCIGIEGNWAGCTRCHTGYGWKDGSYDFTVEENVDCLVCHAEPSTYVKSLMGLPAEGVDLVAAAQTVARPTRQNCGSCHFNGGGGNAVKHGDLDESLYFPNENIDVHMGRFDFECVDCHQTENHDIAGQMMSVSPTAQESLSCTDCHAGAVHEDERINLHLDGVACQTCHIPLGALRDATKVNWDWSTAGQDLPEDPHVYLKIKGSFVYEDQLEPSYAWFDGNSDRYLKGDPIDPVESTLISGPNSTMDEQDAQIWPFKIHTAQQPYDPEFNHLLIPQTVGETGFWTTFDWNQSFANNVANTGLAYSGEYAFTPTEMYWPLTHMVQPKENALQCNECHGDDGRMNWQSLGYLGDPITWGGRWQQLGGAER